MNIIPHPNASATPTILNRQQLDAVVENIVQLRLDHDELRRTQEQEIAAIRQKYRAPLAELERFLDLETSWAQTWAEQNPGVFNEKRSLDCTHAVIGFRTTPPRIERASRKWNWSDIAEKLGEIAWGKRYLRQPPLEVNKEALLSDRAELLPAELRQVGLKIVREDRFFITPHATTEATEEWQEAA